MKAIDENLVLDKSKENDRYEKRRLWEKATEIGIDIISIALDEFDLFLPSGTQYDTLYDVQPDLRNQLRPGRDRLEHITENNAPAKIY